MAVMGVNLILGNLGKAGGLVPRSEIPVQTGFSESELAPVVALHDVPDRSIRLLFIEDPGTSLPIAWEAIERKLSGDHPIIVALSPYLTGLSRRADLFIPTPAPFEALTDTPPPPHAVTASFAVAAPLLAPPAGIVDPVGILSGLFSTSGTSEEFLRERVEAIRKQGRGTLFSYQDGSYADVNSFDSSEKFWNTLVAGAVWLDGMKPAGPLSGVSLLGKGSEGGLRMRESALRPERLAAETDSRFSLLLLPFVYTPGGGVGQISPLLTKVYQESGLRFTSDKAVIEPATAAAAGLEDGDLAYVETQRGSHTMRITVDSSVLPGVILASVGPDPVAFTREGLEFGQNSLPLIELDADGAWTPTAAALRKAS
jgi:anaerobic selenocysteine-containing dehydrogenase